MRWLNPDICFGSDAELCGKNNPSYKQFEKVYFKTYSRLSQRMCRCNVECNLVGSKGCSSNKICRCRPGFSGENCGECSKDSTGSFPDCKFESREERLSRECKEFVENVDFGDSCAISDRHEQCMMVQEYSDIIKKKFMSSCSCGGVICNAQGSSSCIDGVCECRPGFSGESCGECSKDSTGSFPDCENSTVQDIDNICKVKKITCLILSYFIECEDCSNPDVDDVVPQDDAPQDDAPQDDVPQDDVPQDDVPQDDVPQDDVPQDDVSQDDEPLRGNTDTDEREDKEVLNNEHVLKEEPKMRDNMKLIWIISGCGCLAVASSTVLVVLIVKRKRGHKAIISGRASPDVESVNNTFVYENVSI